MANPTELVLTSAEATALGGTADTITGMTFIQENASFYDLDTNNNAVRNRIAETGNAFRLVKINTGLGYGVFEGKFQYGESVITYAGLASGTFTDDATNYVYLQPDGTLVENTTGYPTTPHFKIATVPTGSASAATVSGKYAFADIVDDRAANMWGLVGVPGNKIVTSQTLEWGDFDDNGDTTGYRDFLTDIPAGSYVLGWQAVVATGFTGDTSAIMQLGVAGDLDAFTADTSQSIFAAGTVGSAALAATAYVGAATTPRVTITSATDFSTVNTGEMVVTITYVEAG